MDGVTEDAVAYPIHRILLGRSQSPQDQGEQGGYVLAVAGTCGDVKGGVVGRGEVG